MSPEEDRTHDAVDSEPKHYQRAIPAPHVAFNRLLLTPVDITEHGQLYENLCFAKIFLNYWVNSSDSRVTLPHDFNLKMSLFFF